jgi:hypothetical protein
LILAVRELVGARIRRKLDGGWNAQVVGAFYGKDGKFIGIRLTNGYEPKEYIQVREIRHGVSFELSIRTHCAPFDYAAWTEEAGGARVEACRRLRERANGKARTKATNQQTPERRDAVGCVQPESRRDTLFDGLPSMVIHRIRGRGDSGNFFRAVAPRPDPANPADKPVLGRG